MRLSNFALLAFFLAAAQAQTLNPGGGGGSIEPTGSAGGDLAGTYPDPTIGEIQGTVVSGVTGTGNVVFSSGPTFSGTVTMPDGSTWASTGLSDAAAYTTITTTAPISLSFTDSYSVVSGNTVKAFDLSPTMTSTGASSASVTGLNITPTLGSSSNNINVFTGESISLSEPAGYTGTVTAARALNLSGGTPAGKAYGTLELLNFAPMTNGNGITSGNFTNAAINISAATAVPGAGGAGANVGVNCAMPSGANLGTETAICFEITGNGPTGSGVTPWAILSSSTAPSQFSGNISLVSAFFGQTLTTWADNQTCTAGQITWDASFIYVCTATNTVKRTLLSIF